MSVTKHKIISIPINDKKGFSLEQTAKDQVDKFLADANVVYAGHSICIAREDYREYGATLSRNAFLIVSIVYKDLDGSSHDLKAASSKVKKVIQKSVAEEDYIPEPEIVSDFDRKTKEIGEPKVSEKAKAKE
jgi:hypothetical protein